jgi:acyl-coenzyme A synthetase/AMP-(fatty) acid ligase
MFSDVLDRIALEHGSREAVVWRSRGWTYSWLASRIAHWQAALVAEGLRPGSVLGTVADFSPEAIALFLAAIRHGQIVIPVWRDATGVLPQRIAVGQIEALAEIDTADNVQFRRTGQVASHSLYQVLRDAGHPGLVLFSSGSTGEPKGTVHDLTRLLRKYEVRRKDFRTLAFLLFDHIGGLDTLLYCLSNGSTLVVPEARSAEEVCRAIEQWRVEVLPTAPSFLNLLLLSGAHERYDLSSLRYITYGAEMMPPTTLQRCHQLFPGVELLQKYGTTEVGTLRSQSPESDALWVRIGGEGYDWRVRNGLLELKAESAMLGYLNAPSPFTEDGWFMTGDQVETRDGLIRFRGREADLINVGGQKVSPSEIEAVIAEMPIIADVSVFGEANRILGNVVCARVQAVGSMQAAEVRSLVRQHCAARLPAYKVPSRIDVTDQAQVNERFKKVRRGPAGEPERGDG